MNFKSRAESNEIARQAFLMADRDNSGFLVLAEFFNFLQVIYQRLGICHPLNQQSCQELFMYYDDNGNGMMTPDEIVDVVWDIYSNDIQNDRASIQQMLEKLLIEKLYNRPYGVQGGFMYGNWGMDRKMMGEGGWRKNRMGMFGGYNQGGAFMNQMMGGNQMGNMGGMNQMGNMGGMNQMGNMGQMGMMTPSISVGSMSSPGTQGMMMGRPMLMGGKGKDGKEST